MLKRLLLAKLSTHAPAPMEADTLEQPDTYSGLILPVRYLLAMRYLRIKQQILETFRHEKIYPVPPDAYRQRLIEHLSRSRGFRFIPSRQTNKKSVSGHTYPPLANLFSNRLVYPVLAALVFYTGWSLYQHIKLQRMEQLFASHLPYYTDLLHRKLLIKHNAGETPLKKIEAQIATEKETILKQLPDDELRELLTAELDRLADSSSTIKDVLLGFKAVNTLLDKKGLPFYLSPKSFSMHCSSLVEASVEEMMLLKELEKLLSGNNPELCRTTMMTTYKVKQRNQLYYGDEELPLFLSTRIDKVPAVDNALGLTYRETGIGSLILLDRIKRFTTESVLPALTFQGRSYVIPYWMQGYYEVEELVTKSYKKDLNRVFATQGDQLAVRNAVRQLLRDKARLNNSRMQQTLQRNSTDFADNSVLSSGIDAISVLLGKSANQNNSDNKTHPAPLEAEIPQTLLEKLDQALLPSIEYHEAYHQLDKSDWTTPDWQKTVFKAQDEHRIEHSMEELGAYLSQLAQTESAHNIWLGKLLIFSLNPLTLGSAEYYASGLILTTLQSLYQGEPVKPRYSASVEEKTRIFKVLSAMDSTNIKKYSREAFEFLFQREVPELKR